MVRWSLASGVCAGFLALAGCHRESAPSAPKRSCGLTVWYRPSSPASRVEILGSWNGWARPGRTLPPSREDGWRFAHWDLPPGEYNYAVVDDGTWLPNPNVATTAFHDGQEVTWAAVESCESPVVRADRVQSDGHGRATVEATVQVGQDGTALEPNGLVLRHRSDERWTGPGPSFDAATGKAVWSLEGLPEGKSSFEIQATDKAGRKAEPVRVSVWQDKQAFDLRDAVVYQIMVDRFRGSEGPLGSPTTPGHRAGGTLRGILQEVQAGYFRRLGINVLWLSPVYKNPEGLFPGADGRSYSSYHGYWPTDSRSLDPRLGTNEDLEALVREVHRQGVRLILDVVPNHVHEQHAYWLQHASKWFHPKKPECICGQGACDWGRHIETCWFTPYLPDLDWKQPDVVTQGVEDILFWMDRFDVDGVRVDAVPMMPRSATRRLVAGLRERFEHPGNPLVLLGENFTGPGGYRQLKYHMGPFGLPSQFHFPLMWSLRSAVATETEGMKAVADAILQGEEIWAGSNSIMATMIGNHDVTRFSSESAGDAGGDPWVGAPQASDPLVYAKQRLALGAVFTLPGAPVVYYGDEVGLAGRGDPDCRRVMPRDVELTEPQRQTRSFVERLGALRQCQPSLRRGAFRLLAAETEVLAFVREGEGLPPVTVVLSRKPGGSIRIPTPGVPPGIYVDMFSGQETTLTSELTFPSTEPFSVRVLVPQAQSAVCK